MATPFKALTLYTAGASFKREDYIRAADLYLLHLLSKPVSLQGCFYSKKAWLLGVTLDVLCRGFLAAHSDIDAEIRRDMIWKASETYQLLQRFRTSGSPCFSIGYSPSGVSADKVADGAFSDDLGLVGRGLASYYAVSGNEQALDDLVSLSGYFLREHQPGSAEGCFSERIGSWVICPWPVEIAAEHIIGKRRADQISWGFSAREAIDFLSRLYQWTQDKDLKDRIRQRTIAGMKWAFDECQFEDGSVGMFGRDDPFTGMTGAAILNLLDCRDSGIAGESVLREYTPKACKAFQWLVSWPCSDLLEKAGYHKVHGEVGLEPPGNLTWMLAWTADALIKGDSLFENSPLRGCIGQHTGAV